MPSTKVRVGGVEKWIEHEAGATPETIKALARQQATTREPVFAGVGVAQPGDDVKSMPSVSAYLGKNLKERSGDIAGMVATAPFGGSGLTQFAKRLLAAEAGKDAVDYVSGNRVTPGVGAVSQAIGEGAGKLVAPLLSPATYKAFATRTAKTLGDWLKSNVPAWSHLPSSAKGLYEMAHGTGQRSISQAFDDALAGIVPQVRGATVWLRADDLAKLGIKPTTLRELPTAHGSRAPVLEEGEVPLTEAIDKLTGMWRRDPSLYRRAVDRVAEELDLRNLGREYADARQAYKVGAGFMEFAEKGQFLHGERFDPAKAQAALDTVGKKTLLRRGLDPIREIVRGPGDKPIEAVKHSPFLQRLEGGVVGGALGMPFGIPHSIGGAVGGVVAGGALPRTTYKNVPTTPLMDFAARLGPVAVGQGAREAARFSGITEKLPGSDPVESGPLSFPRESARTSR